MESEQFFRPERFRAQLGIDLLWNTFAAEDRAQLLAASAKHITKKVCEGLWKIDAVVGSGENFHHGAGDFRLWPEAPWGNRRDSASDPKKSREYRDRSIVSATSRGDESVGDLTLDQYHLAATVRTTQEHVHHQRRRGVVGEIGNKSKGSFPECVQEFWSKGTSSR